MTRISKEERQRRRLIRRADTFGQIAEDSRKTLFRLSVRILKDDELAEDIVQEALALAWEKRKMFGGRSEPTTWLGSIAVHLALNKLKRQRMQERLTSSLEDPVYYHSEGGAVTLHDSIPSREGDPAEQCFATEFAENLAEVVLELKRKNFNQWQAWILRVVYGLSYEEIAEVIKSKGGPGVVKSRIHNARQFLRIRMSKRYEREPITLSPGYISLVEFYLSKLHERDEGESSA